MKFYERIGFGKYDKRHASYVMTQLPGEEFYDFPNSGIIITLITKKVKLF